MFLKGFDKVFDMLPTLGEQMGSADSIIDEQFPHIAKKILFLWGSQECVDYIEQDLLHFTPTPERPERAGFPLQVLLELDIILNEHIKRFPLYRSSLKDRQNDPWNNWK